ALDIVDAAGFRQHFDAIAISETVGWRKPRSEIFRAVLDELEVAPDEVLHVGDSLRADVAGAAPLGMRTAWITRRVRDPEVQLSEHEGPAPDHQVADLAELLELLA
ncbi:MAG: HAD-IA family hydrolase, partial [Deltaproteobacteria bacterium]|nr:HAD-IA family hydrolase [Deltaproteobacteria bacterium]